MVVTITGEVTRRKLTVEGAPVMCGAFSSKAFRPESVEVCTVDGEFVYLDIRGRFVKRDGTFFASRGTARSEGWFRYNDVDKACGNPLPEWVRDILDLKAGA